MQLVFLLKDCNSDDVQKKVNEIYQQIKSGAIVVADKQGDLFR